eukprot:9497801-Pyramimonas_sp.AAC.1
MGSGPQLPEDVAPAGRGLGLGLQIREAPLFKRAVEDGFVRIRAAGRTPTYWHTSQGISWPKKTEGVTDIGDAAFGLRTVHLLAPLGKAWYAGNSSLPLMPRAVHGFLKGRCKDNAIIAVNTTRYRIKQAGRSCLQHFHGLSSAFGSIEWAELDDVSMELMREDPGGEFGQQRYRDA